MMIKKISHFSNNIKRLLKYVINGMQDPQNDLVVSYNLQGFDVDSLTHQYLKNDAYRAQGFGKIKWYHEILSFSHSDSEHLNNEKLETIAHEYIARRNDRALAFCTAHLSEGHSHLHFIFSGSEFRSKKTLRMDNKQFHHLRHGMEHWQMKQFPQLSNSIVFINKEREKVRGKHAALEREYQTKKRLGEDNLTEKEELQEAVMYLYNTSTSIAEFLKTLEADYIETYERNGKVAGILGKRKYRFSTLGISKQMFMSLDRFAQRQREMEALRGRKDDERGR